MEEEAAQDHWGTHPLWSLMEKGWEPEFSPLTLSWFIFGPPLQVLESKASLLMEPVVKLTRAP